ncbi:glycosyltransferase [Hungatella hathewayi]
MLFSIIVPVYKVEKYLSQCIESIVYQSFDDFELILVDDGSPDSCPQICDDYAKQDTRIKVIHKKNGGISSARNIGLEGAKGDYIVYLDSDDFFLDNKSLAWIAEQAGSNADIIMYKTAECNDNGSCITYPDMDLNIRPDEYSIVQMLKKAVSGEEFQTSAWCKAIKRQFLADNHIQFKEGLAGEDIDWYLNVIRKVKSFAVVDRYLYVYRNRVGSITKSCTIKNLKDLIWILYKWDRELKDTEIDKALRQYLGKTYTGLLIMYADILGSEKWVYKDKIKKISYLLSYDAYPRTKIIKKIYSVFGFNVTIQLLKAALKIKKSVRK